MCYLWNVLEERSWFVTGFIYFSGNSASALCYVKFDLLQNISLFPKLYRFVNELIYNQEEA